MSFSLYLLSLAGGLLLGSATGQTQAPAGASVSSAVRASKWQHRVLLVCAPNPTDPQLRRQRELLAAVPTELRQRDVLVREVVFSGASAADQRYLRQQLGVSATGFTVVLLGKDGGVKRRETQPITSQQLFATIDVMPMRRQEMRARP